MKGLLGFLGLLLLVLLTEGNDKKKYNTQCVAKWERHFEEIPVALQCSYLKQDISCNPTISQIKVYIGKRCGNKNFKSSTDRGAELDAYLQHLRKRRQSERLEGNVL